MTDTFSVPPLIAKPPQVLKPDDSAAPQITDEDIAALKSRPLESQKKILAALPRETKLRILQKLGGGDQFKPSGPADPNAKMVSDPREVAKKNTATREAGETPAFEAVTGHLAMTSPKQHQTTLAEGAKASWDALTEFVGGTWDAAKGTWQLVRQPQDDHEKEIYQKYGPPAVIGKRLIDAGVSTAKSAKDLYQAWKQSGANEYDLDAMLWAVPRALGQYAGSEAIGKGVSKVHDVVTNVEKGAKVIKDLKKNPDVAQREIQTYAGTGPQVAEEIARKTKDAQQGEEAKVGETNKAKFEKYNETRESGRVAHEKATKKAEADQEKANAEAEKKNKELSRDAEATNKEAARQYEEDKAKVKEINDAQNEAVGRRQELAKQIPTKAEEVGTVIRQVEAAAKAKGNAMYAPIQEAVGKLTVPASDMAEEVAYAQEHLLQGTPESIKQFNDIMKRGDEEMVSGLRERFAKDYGGSSYDDLSADEKAEVNERIDSEMDTTEREEPMDWNYLQGIYTELGDKLYEHGANLLGDVRRAVTHVRNSVGEQMMEMARQVGKADELTAAQRYWAKYKDAFYNRRSIANGGSPVARIIQNVRNIPEYNYLPFIRAGGDIGIQLLRDFSSEAADKVQALVKDFREMESLPKTAKLKADPAPPKVVEPKTVEPKTVEKPVAEPHYGAKQPMYDHPAPPPTMDELISDLQKTKAERLRRKSEAIGTINRFDVAALFGAAIKVVELPFALAYVLGHYLTGKLMRMPAVTNWLTQITPADIAALKKVYAKAPEAGDEAKQSITDMLEAKAQSGEPLPSLKKFNGFLSPAQIQRILRAAAKRLPGTGAAAVGAGQQVQRDTPAPESTTPQNMPELPK